MNIESEYMKIIEVVQKELAESTQTLDHTLRVYKNCLVIAGSEKKVDLTVLKPAALLHDVARVRASKEKVNHASLGGEMAEEILRNLNYSNGKIEKIKYCIVTHSLRTGNEPETIEAKILFDGDKLDNLGAAGIARTFMLAGKFGQRLRSPSLDNNECSCLKHVSEHSPFTEYEQKFKKIPQKLYTKKGKELANERLSFMENFFNRLKSEI